MRASRPTSAPDCFFFGGLRESVTKFAKETGVDPQEAMQLVTLTGYTDMLRDVAASSSTNTLLLPPSPSGISDLITSLKASGVSGSQEKSKN